MPELPEVETIRKQLSEVLPLKVVACTQSQHINGIAHTTINLANRTIQSIHRKGKLLYFKLDQDEYLLSHLGMSGQWRIADHPPQDKLAAKHTHLLIHHATGVLAYVDPRRFGHMYQLNHEDTQKKLNALGADLSSHDYTLSYLTHTIKRYPQRMIKVHLLDQKLYAGSGNYIVNEMCARAGILPMRKNESLSKKEMKALYHATQVVIEGATTSGGTTFQGGYADTSGAKGAGVQHLVVFYQKICRLCNKTEVSKIFLSQRGTYYCTHCQK